MGRPRALSAEQVEWCVQMLAARAATLTTRQMGERLGLSAQTVSMVQRGERGMGHKVTAQIGALIRENCARRAQTLTMAQMARQLGVCQETVAHALGKRQPHQERLYRRKVRRVLGAGALTMGGE